MAQILVTAVCRAELRILQKHVWDSCTPLSRLGVSPAILACPRLHFPVAFGGGSCSPASLWECSPKVNLPCTRCSWRPGKGSAVAAGAACPALYLRGGDGGIGTLPTSLPCLNSVLHPLPGEGSAGGSSDLCRSCWALAQPGCAWWRQIHPRGGSSPGTSTILLHSHPGAGAVPPSRTQRAPGFLCALQRACRYGGKGI